MMFGIVLVGYLSYRNGLRARLKGQNPFMWGIITFAAFLAMMVLGMLIVIVYFCRDLINLNQLSSTDPKSIAATQQQIMQVFDANPLHYITVVLFGVGGYLFVRYILDRKPNKKEPEVHWMDRMGKSE